MDLGKNAPEGQELTRFRRELRNRLVAERLAMPAAVRASASAAIERHLEALLSALPEPLVAFCWPYRGEVDVRPLMLRLLAGGRRAFLPVVVAEGAAMLFREWGPETPMETDRHGIPVPVSGPPASPGLMLIPVNGFDAAGYRLGYGGGYFDRTLGSLSPRPVSIGVGFELARVETIHPQPFDVPLDYVVTEAGVSRITADGLRPL